MPREPIRVPVCDNRILEGRIRQPGVDNKAGFLLRGDIDWIRIREREIRIPSDSTYTFVPHLCLTCSVTSLWVAAPVCHTLCDGSKLCLSCWKSSKTQSMTYVHLLIYSFAAKCPSTRSLARSQKTRTAAQPHNSRRDQLLDHLQQDIGYQQCQLLSVKSGSKSIP